MKASLHEKLETIAQTYEQLSQKLSDPKIISDQNQFRDLSKEFASIEPIVNCFRRYQKVEEEIEATNSMIDGGDQDMAEMAQEELKELNTKLETLEAELKVLLLPKNPDDDCNIYLEIRAGTGGDEASIFAGDLFRMYSRYADLQHWKVEVLSAHEGEHGGFKEIISRVTGKSVYAQLKFESGAHRVQRVPDTEAQGRIHTSACTVAVMPEIETIDEVEINPADVRTDTYRSSGAGGQHVNTTDSAVRLTHIPTGIVVECQDERSQHKNRAKAMKLLAVKIVNEERAKQEKAQAETRRNLVGTGDRSERIRTYNYPQGRVTDHRINLTLYKLPAIMEGDLKSLIEALQHEHQADLMASIGE